MKNLKKLMTGSIISVLFASVLSGCNININIDPQMLAGLKENAASSLDTKTYESKDGWSVSYDADLIEAAEIDGHSAQFVYTGDSAGTNMVVISFVEGKQPEEALSEFTDGWTDMKRSEGIFPGTDDKWGYWRETVAEPEGSGFSECFIAGEYNGGALIFDIVSHMGNDEEMNMLVSDTLSEVINSIVYENFEPQSIYSYIPGKYTDESGNDIIILKEDHTGTLSLLEDADILWGSIELMAADGSFTYEYTIEGSDLMLNIDGNWRRFTKKVEGKDYIGTWRPSTGEYINLKIQPTENEEYYEAAVYTSVDRPYKDIYTMTPLYQEDGSLYYEDCTYYIQSSDEKEDREVIYEKGAGLFYYSFDEDVLYWTDYEIENKEERVTTFVRVQGE